MWVDVMRDFRPRAIVALRRPKWVFLDFIAAAKFPADGSRSNWLG